MNSIALLISTLAAFGQISAGATPPGVKAGWKPEADGSMSYIAQVTPEIAQQMATQGQEMALDIPDFLQGRVNRIVWRIGSGDVEREPSEAEMRAMPARQVFPKSDVNPLGSGGLSSLSDHTSGNTVMIDSPRSGAMTMPTAGPARLAEYDPSLPPIPSLAQSYTSPSARAAQASQFDTYRSGLNSAGSGASGPAPVLPRQDTLPPNNSKPVFGPQLPPTGYTGGQVTVTGTPSGASNSNAWNDGRSGATSGQYGAGNPLANGTFGNSNNFGAVNNGSLYSAPPNSSYAATNLQGYSGTTNSQNNGTAYPNSATQYNAAGQPIYTNTNTRPDAYLASNNPNYGASPYAAGSAGQAYPQAPSAAQPWNGSYAATGTNYTGMMPNAGAMPPTVPYVASNPQIAPPLTRPMVDGTRRTTSSRDEIAYDHIPATPPSYVVALLLASLVGNAYLVMLLNQLLQRYRTLQASSRGSTSLAI